jgi:NADH-quinone oxidoreductase subunit N
MNLSWENLWVWAWPYWILLIGAFLSLMSAVVRGRWAFRLTGILAGLSFAAAAYNFSRQAQGGMTKHLSFLLIDPLGSFLGLVISLIALVSLIISFRYWEERDEPLYEAIPLMVFAALGMCLMVATTHLLTLVLALELMSLSLYALVGTRRTDPTSSEAALKYFILGSVAAAFLLFGVSFLYGATGSLDLADFVGRVIFPEQIPSSIYIGKSLLEQAPLFQIGVWLLLLGLAFKAAAVPLHFWAPDAYDGAPAPVTGFMATGVKVAAFGALLRVLQVLVHWQALDLERWLGGLSLATMLVGNFTALRQKSIKRLMAYSSIAHAGYLLLGLTALVKGSEWHSEALSPILFYLAVYGMLTLGVFAILTTLCRRDREIQTLDDLNGLAERHPALAAALSVFLISLAGIPPSAGFFAKYLLFGQAIKNGLFLLAVLGILSSAVSLYYYLAPVVRMFFHKWEPRTLFPQMGWGMKVLVFFLVLGAFYLGILPGRVWNWTRMTSTRPQAFSTTSGR